MAKKYVLNISKFVSLILIGFFTNSSFSQVEIASQRFHNGNPDYQFTVADKDGIWAPPSQAINTHVGTDDWDYTATTSNGIIRVVNTDITNPASDLYSLELKNYWDDAPTLAFIEKDISSYVNVTFSIAYQSIGDPDNNEDLLLDYSYFNGGSWVNNTVSLIEGQEDGFTDIRLFGVSFPNPNPFVVSIPDTATAFRATIRATFVNGADGNDNYYIDDVILQGDAITTPPNAVCQGDFSIELDAYGSASITANDIDNGSSISSGTMSLSIDKTDFTCADLGPNIITLTVDDGIQATTCTTTVTINNYTGPITAPILTDVSTFCSYTASTPQDLSYQCGSLITPTTSDPTTFTTPGNYSISWLYYDSATGNSITTVQNIILNPLTVTAGISVSNIGADSVTITWDEQIGVETYEIQYKKNGLINWETVTASGNTIDLVGLDQLTSYDFRVAAVCASSSIYSSVDNFTTVGHNYCQPSVGNTSNRVYVRTVNVGTINNTEGREPGGYDDNTHLSTVLYKNEAHTFNLTFRNSNYYNIGHTVWIDYNGDGDFEDADEMVWNNNGNLSNNGQNQTHNPSIFIPSYAVTGPTRMRVAVRQDWYPDEPCNDDNWDGKRGEFEDYMLDLQIKPDSPQEIDVTGNGNIIIDESSVAELNLQNNTDFGTYDVYEVPLIKTYKITNNGADPLTLTGSPLVSFLTNTGDFTITQPAISVLAIGESTTFTITFDPTTVGIKTATIQILNDDIDAGDTEEQYTFLVQGDAVKTFPDTDGDGVPDNIDGDDDNDGILDTEEDSACKTYSYSTQVETVFLNETFGSGYDRVEIDESNEGVTTTYCYEDGTGSCNNSNNLNDGSYTIYYKAGNGDGVNQTPNAEVASWADTYWYTGLDHTPDSVDGTVPGRMLLINADYDPGIFYSATINGVTPGVEVTYGFSVLNLDRSNAPCLNGCPGGASWDDNPRNRPEVLIAVYDPNGNSLIPTTTSGLIEPTDYSNSNGDWITVETTFTTTSSQFTVQLINSQSGGAGNDLAIDDIYVKQILCDMDGDGVADSIDLDNDNDGIPNVVELGLADTDKDATLFGDGWLDANGNGVHDSFEGGAPLIDTDGDGVADYLDPDSDNDGIFDAVEYDGYGDIDVNGDGIGDGFDGESLNNADDFDGDGLLTIVDGNDDDDDEFDHGTSNYPDPIDSDGDGIPNYLDTDSNDATNNPLNGSDIYETIYSSLDLDNDGVIDGSVDTDMDGILDAFDTDNNVYGSPRDLDDSYTLFFDGRNDYVAENSVINGWKDATIMAWIKIDSNASGNMRIVGQKEFFIAVNSNGTASAYANGSTLVSSLVLPKQIWVHIAASYNDSGDFNLFINGDIVSKDVGSGSLATDNSSFTIGRTPDTDNEYFHGDIDEVRVFNTSLTEDEIQKMVYQELDETNNFNSGKVIPKDISPSIGSNLVRYFKMEGVKGDILDNKVTATIDEGFGAKIYNIKDIYFQTAPLPYQTVSDGDWTETASWLYGDVWDITDVDNNKDWSIVDVKNNITTSSSHKNLGLFVELDKTLTVLGDNEINNNWYLELNGTMDLLNDSQLIQTENSDLVTSASGKILRRQEGTSNIYWYNYWSSPVGSLSASTNNNNNTLFGNTNNTPFTLNMLKDNYGNAIEFTNSYNENGKVSTKWLYAFQNGVTYYDWDLLSISDNIAPGVGYTQKGTGNAGLSQQYTFEGKPHNGTILLNASDVGGLGSIENSTETTSLVGNPYPSAIDARKFINDNVGIIDGTIKLWEQWAGTSHNTAEYEGGYAYINKLTTVRAYQYPGVPIANQTITEGLKKPSFYIPVSQGFFVEVVSDGDIEFNNNQRVFVKESDADDSNPNVGSTFFRNSAENNESFTNETETTDSYQILRLELSMSNNSSRSIVLGFDDSFTDEGREYGFDGGFVTTAAANDLQSLLNGEKYLIQALAPITTDKEVDLIFNASGNQTYSIKSTEISNIPDDQPIYLRDNLLGVYFDLRNEQSYNFTSEAGTFDNRFDVVFTPAETLSTEDFIESDNLIYFNNNQDLLFVKGLKEKNVSVTLYNTLGQTVATYNNISSDKLENGLSLTNLSTGMYVVSLRTKSNFKIDKKIIVE